MHFVCTTLSFLQKDKQEWMLFNGLLIFRFLPERAAGGAGGGGGAFPAAERETGQWASPRPADGQARPLRHAPPPYDSVFYSVFRAAASHVVFLRDQFGPWSGPVRAPLFVLP